MDWDQKKTKDIIKQKLREWGVIQFQYSDNLYIRHGEMYQGELSIADEILIFECTQCGRSKDIPNYGSKQLFRGHIKCPDCDNTLFLWNERNESKRQKKDD